MVVVSEREIAVAVLRLMEAERIVQEGAGAAGLAAVLAGRIDGLAGATDARKRKQCDCRRENTCVRHYLVPIVVTREYRLPQCVAQFQRTLC